MCDMISGSNWRLFYQSDVSGKNIHTWETRAPSRPDLHIILYECRGHLIIYILISEHSEAANTDRIPSNAAPNGTGTTHAPQSRQNTSKDTRGHMKRNRRSIRDKLSVFTVWFDLLGREVWPMGDFSGMFRPQFSAILTRFNEVVVFQRVVLSK